MFTGIVSAVSKVVEAERGRLAIDHAAIARRLKIGASVAVNGCCLTVVRKRGPVFYMDVVPETLRRTNLDATAAVKRVEKAASGKEVTIELPTALSRFVAAKGSIAVDGVSLTVAAVDQPPGTFKVALIPHTLEMTIANDYRPGSMVNLEADVVARYVARGLAGGRRR